MNEWDIQDITGPAQVRLTRGELLLIDWIISTGSSLLSGKVLDDLVEGWHDFRQTVWRTIGVTVLNDQPLGALIALDEFTVKVLLAACPTTFQWGDGVDHGYRLKVKLFAFLEGTYIDDLETQAAAQAESERVKAEEVAKRDLVNARSALVSAENALASAAASTKTTAVASKEARQKYREAQSTQSKAALKVQELEKEAGNANETSDQAEDNPEDPAGPPAV